ncbi:hypothetical protein N7485_002865 [Penicillium canescens]|nr:hypothetical protein N7485_002865 [Penicillium canescens]
MSQYNSLWRAPQKLIFHLGNIVNDVYTGSFNVTLTAHFSYRQAIPTDNTTVMLEIPAAASRAVVSISACGQSEEEFWWSNVLNEDTQYFESTPEIDISPFLPMLQDGELHSFEIRVPGLNASVNGIATLANTVGSYWVITGNIFLYTGEDSASEAVTVNDSEVPRVEAPLPTFTISRKLAHNYTGGNDSLSYSVVAERTFRTESSRFSWSQTLSFSNYGLLNQQGYSQVNKQLTAGKNIITERADIVTSNSTSFEYPLVVNATYGITTNGLTIDSWMTRGPKFETTGGPDQLLADLQLHGVTVEKYESEAYEQTYQQSVHAINGTVVYNTDSHGKAQASPQDHESGRGSVRAILGNGPGSPAL